MTVPPIDPRYWGGGYLGIGDDNFDEDGRVGQRTRTDRQRNCHKHHQHSQRNERRPR